MVYSSSFPARAPHSASSSMLLAPETTAQAYTSRTAVREYHRPPRPRIGDGPEIGAYGIHRRTVRLALESEAPSARSVRHRRGWRWIRSVATTIEAGTESYRLAQAQQQHPTVE